MKNYFKYSLIFGSILLFVLAIVLTASITEFIELNEATSSIFRIDIVIYVFIAISLLVVLLITILSFIKGTKNVIDYLNVIIFSIFIVFIVLYMMIWLEIDTANKIINIDVNELLVLINILPVVLNCIIAQGILVIVVLTTSNDTNINLIQNNTTAFEAEEKEEEKLLSEEVNKLRAKLKIKELEEEYISLRSKLDEKTKK